MPTPGQELSTIDFEAMLGGPLVAVVNAQAQSAMATVNFIKEVGFKKLPGDQDPENAETADPIYVTFKYPKELSPFQPAVAEELDADGNVTTPASDAVPAVWEEQKLQVPILTMLPIPFIRIEETTIDFNAKITSTSYRKTDTQFKIDAELEAKAGWLWGSAKLKVTTSYQRNTQQGNDVKRNYSMKVHIKAVQDEMPVGMEKVLGILEDAIKAQPAQIAG